MSILNNIQRSRIESILIDRVSVDTKYSGDPHDPSPSCWNWNKFGSGSRNLGDLLYLMNGEFALKSSALDPPPE